MIGIVYRREEVERIIIVKNILNVKRTCKTEINEN